MKTRFLTSLAMLFPSLALAQETDRSVPTMEVSAQAVALELQTAPNQAAIRMGFINLSPGARIYVQKVMARAGFYDKQIDGLYGPSTERAAIALQAWLSQKSAGALDYDLSTPRGVTEMFSFLRAKGAEEYLS